MVNQLQLDAITLRRLVAEVFGTFALVIVAAGGEVVANVVGDVSPAARAVAPGLLVMAMIYAIGNCSGAHFNPAISLGFALRGAFPWEMVPAYWLAQIIGALLAGGFLRLVFPGAADLGATHPHAGVAVALAFEVLLTTLLVTVALGTATRHELIGPNAAVAVGGTIALAGLIGGPVNGASMNPARSLGPALFGGTTQSLWIYLLGPALGALAAVILAAVVHPHKHDSEHKAAGGDPPPREEQVTDEHVPNGQQQPTDSSQRRRRRGTHH
jgi:aquaporin Z